MHPDHRRYYAPALGFLMFSVGVNSSEKDFLKAFKRPTSVLAGYTGQFLVKPLLGYVFGFIAVAIFGLPTPVGAGIILVSCVNGAQSQTIIVMASLSTASAVFITPFLSLLLIGKLFLLQICDAIRPFLPPLSPAMSSFGLTVLLLFIACYLTAFIAGYFLTGVVFHTTPDVKALQRTLSYETDSDHVFDGLLPRHGLRKKERTMTKRISIVESWFDGLQHMENFFLSKRMENYD
ncbi:sodium/metabolite cotransporter BASS5 [Pyrus ussuriensis x Pyrus communis]|uniref:Sodium/metabolite cotransporter BASS5 n=1 Tax=Pyrus ussuriensis x Pyrus communis TaxID=2448454 RepID=A0A5N5H3X0_9ROSA|nr:sodium/metabolite cotransporter BASS5 [Pyrus ussuriensis x Pyrus communis]